MDSTSLARAVYEEALRAVRADRLTASALETRLADLRQYRRVLVVGAGKPVAAMAQAVEEALGEGAAAGVVATKYGHSLPLRRIEVLEAGHPVPDEGSLVAGKQIVELLQGAGPEDLVIGLISGGASALIESPREGVSLADIQRATERLLRSGAPIEEINAVRRRLSLVKGGGLAAAAFPARCLVLVLSDVLGNPLEAIGSGPFCAGGSGPSAEEVAERYGLDVPLSSPNTEGAGLVEHVLVGDVNLAVEAAAAAAQGLGLAPQVLDRAFSGRVEQLSAILAGAARGAAPGTCAIVGGEPTVIVRGPGRGGRCQEAACRVAGLIDGLPGVAVLAGSTDGTDGPTDAAGAVVDGESAKRAGLSVREALAQSDSERWCQAAGAAFVTGPTRSNVNDLYLVVRGVPAPSRVSRVQPD